MLGIVRYILAAMVVASHTKGEQNFWFDPGIVAVTIFFIISGYLMPFAFERNYKNLPFLAHVSRFYLNRLWRIFPVYLICLGIFFIVVPQTEKWSGSYDFSVMSVIHNIALFGINQYEIWGDNFRYIGTSWTIDIELQYYIIVPIILIIYRKYSFIGLTILIILFAISCYYFYNKTGLQIIDNSFIPWLFFFLIGFFLYIANSSIVNARTNAKNIWGDITYPMFLIHPVVIQAGIPAYLASFVGPSYWTNFLCNLTVSTIAALAIHLAVDGWIDVRRARNRTHQPI